jgi:hypothetical protein
MNRAQVFHTKKHRFAMGLRGELNAVPRDSLLTRDANCCAGLGRAQIGLEVAAEWRFLRRMKNSVTPLLVCGTLLVLAPILHSFYIVHRLTMLMQETRSHVDFNAPLPDFYQSWCLALGAGLFATAAWSVLNARRSHPSEVAV